MRPGHRVTIQIIVATFGAILATATVTAQETLNEYYAFPFSVGAAYIPYSAVGQVDQRATVNEFTARVLIPIPGAPALQPALFGGLATFDSDVSAVPGVYPGGVLNDGQSMPDYDPRDVWDHRQLFAALGMGYAQRISREFEAGAEVFGGVSQSIFPQRTVTTDGEWYPVGELGLVAGAAARVTLNPSFNFSIDITPTVRYSRTFGNLSAFDGVYFGLGIGANVRFGSDPDAPQQSVRAIRVGEVRMPPVFAAMQSVYVREPITSIEISNIEEFPVTDLQVRFNQPGFMDTPTLSARVKSLDPGETATVPILASYNGNVFLTNGISPLNGEITVEYLYRGQPVIQSENVTYDLHDRNALTWDDDRKVAAFITPADSAIGNYASFIRASARDDENDYLPDNLEAAMLAYHALAALGIVYQPDPTAPFTEVQENTVVVDSVSLPRETLRNITGDCDDITVLFNALLESQGVPTGFVTIPGHIYSAIDTKVEPREFARVHPDRDMTIEVNGSLWIFVEITLIGSTNFLDAWQTGMRQWRQLDDQVDLRDFNMTAEAQTAYRPVGLVESDLGLQYGETREPLLRSYRTDVSRLANIILAPIHDQVEDRPSARRWNHYGATAAQLGQYETAAMAFRAAASLDPGDLAAPLNEGSLLFLQGEYDEALAAFRKVESLVNEREEVQPRVSLTIAINLARTLYELERFEEAAEYISEAKSIDPEEAARYEAIAAVGSTQTGTRASAVVTGPDILFIDEGPDS